MKKIIFTALLAMPFCVFAQQKYIIQGTVTTIPEGTVLYLENIETGKIDSTTVKNNAFSFTGNVKNTNIGKLWKGDGGGYKKVPQVLMLPVALEAGKILIKENAGLQYASIEGTKTNNEYNAFYTLHKNSYNQIISLNAEFKNPAYSGDYKKQQELGDKQKKIRAELMQEQVNYAAKNPKSFLSVDWLNSLIHNMKQPDGYEAAFENLADNLKKTKQGIEVATFLESKNLTVGKKAPDVTINDINGVPVSIAQENKGKYLFLDFWASWCVPCRAENPYVLAAYNKFKNNNFTVLSISMDDNKERWLKAVAQDKLPWKQLSRLQAFFGEEALLYRVKAIPKNFLIDPSGTIVAMDLKGEALSKKLTEIFSKSKK